MRQLSKESWFPLSYHIHLHSPRKLTAHPSKNDGTWRRLSPLFSLWNGPFLRKHDEKLWIFAWCIFGSLQLFQLGDVPRSESLKRRFKLAKPKEICKSIRCVYPETIKKFMGHFQLVSCCPTGFLLVSSLHSLVWAIEQRWKSVESLAACCKQAPNSASARKALVWLQFLQRNLQRCAPSTSDFCWLTGSPCYAHWAILRSRWTYNPYNTSNITHLILNGLYFLFGRISYNI